MSSWYVWPWGRGVFCVASYISEGWFMTVFSQVVWLIKHNMTMAIRTLESCLLWVTASWVNTIEKRDGERFLFIIVVLVFATSAQPGINKIYFFMTKRAGKRKSF